MTSNQIAWLQTRIQKDKNEFDKWKQSQDLANTRETLAQKDRELNLRQAELAESKRRNDQDNANASASRVLEESKYKAQNKSAQKVAKINAKSSQQISRRQARTSKDVAKINSSTSKKVAAINSATSQKVAQISASASKYKADKDYIASLTNTQLQTRNAKAMKIIDKAIADKKVDKETKVQLKKMKNDLAKQKIANAAKLEGVIATRANALYNKYEKWGKKVVSALKSSASKVKPKTSLRDTMPHTGVVK